MDAGREMNGGSPPRKASEWLAALLERPEDAVLRRRFDDWLAADPAHAKDWAEMARTYEVMGRTAPRHRDQWAAWAATRPGSRRLPDIGLRNVAHPPRWRRRVALAAIAAGIAAALVLTVFPEVRWRLTADHVTATAELETVHLPDGSTVRLAPDSALDVAFAGDERGVRLLRGAAFFEVMRDPAHPFRVRADSIETTVLGTAFEVRLDEHGATVAVRHGLVQVEDRAGATAHPERLKAGDWISVARTGAVTHGSQPPAQVAAWLQHRLIVKDRPVSEVVDALRPYYEGVVVLRGDALARQKLTGIYDLGDPVGALKAVAGALDAKTLQLSPWVFVLSDR